MSIKVEGVLGCDVTSMSKCGTVVSLFYPQEDSFLLIKNERTSHQTTYGSILVPNPLLTPSSPIYRATIALTRPSWSPSVGAVPYCPSSAAVCSFMTCDCRVWPPEFSSTLPSPEVIRYVTLQSVLVMPRSVVDVRDNTNVASGTRHRLALRVSRRLLTALLGAEMISKASRHTKILLL